jgi:predicted ATPase with chaperone activity
MSIETGYVPSQPQSIADTGLRTAFLRDLALKTVYLGGELSLNDISTQILLDFGIVEELFQSLRRDKLIEVKGLAGGNYRIAVSGLGKSRAIEALAQSSYCGPAPITLEAYTEVARRQTLKSFDVRAEDMKRAFEHYTASEELLRQAGAAAVSGTSAFLYGPAGVGKTMLANAMAHIYSDFVWIPYCLEVDNQIITIYDATIHNAVEQPEPLSYDGRWVLCQRPRVLTGGELSADLLDLQFNPISKFYAAPLQLKANNGVLIIDDLGRQRISPTELLNRWVVPLDRHIDFLTLMGGKSFKVPFDIFVIFSTNLNPRELADEAFLRRIPNKIKLGNLSPEQFHEVFERECEAARVAYKPTVVDHLIGVITSQLKQNLRACIPKDIIRLISWEAQYRGEAPTFTDVTAEKACRAYFLDTD